MWLGPANQLIQIDTGAALTYIYSGGSGAINTYPGIGENQILGQRYVGYNSATKLNPSGSPAIYILCQYLSTSATTLANWQTANAPAPVYFTDTTFTTVSGIQSESYLTNQMVAGYMMPNYASLPNLTLAQLLAGQFLVQVAGYLPGAYGPASGGGAGNNIYGNTGAFQSQATASALAVRGLGVQLTAVASGLCNVLVNSDIF